MKPVCKNLRNKGMHKTCGFHGDYSKLLKFCKYINLKYKL